MVTSAYPCPARLSKARTGADRPMVAIFDCSGQVGVGVYQKRPKGPTNICLYVDQEGNGSIQFANAKGEAEMLSFDDVKRLKELLDK